MASFPPSSVRLRETLVPVVLARSVLPQVLIRGREPCQESSMTMRPFFDLATFPLTHLVVDPETRDTMVRPIHLFQLTTADGSEGR